MHSARSGHPRSGTTDSDNRNECTKERENLIRLENVFCLLVIFFALKVKYKTKN